MIPDYKNKDWLIEQYHTNGLPLKKIGELVNQSDAVIFYWMKKNSIETRKQFYHLEALNKNKEHQSKAGKARAKWTNEHYSHLASKRMKDNNPNKNGIGLQKWKERDPRGYLEHQQKLGKILGDKNAQKWTDWDFFNTHGKLKSMYPYPVEFNKKLKKEIFNRDGGTCQICSKLITNGHSIHHIDYNKENNEEKNLILLCRSCHSKTGMDRGYWESYFNDMKRKDSIT
jgi:hypothetical protein